MAYLENDNQATIDTIRQVETFLKPGETYFDGIGMLSNFRESQRRWLDRRQIHIAQSKGELSDVIQKLRKAPPNLVLESYRTRDLSETLRPFLAGSYIRVAPNILLPGIRIEELDGVVFNVPIASEFAVFDGSGSPVQAAVMLEGQSVHGNLALKPGPVHLKLKSGTETPLFVLPANKTYSALDPEPQPKYFFIGAYSR